MSYRFPTPVSTGTARRLEQYPKSPVADKFRGRILRNVSQCRKIKRSKMLQVLQFASCARAFVSSDPYGLRDTKYYRVTVYRLLCRKWLKLEWIVHKYEIAMAASVGPHLLHWQTLEAFRTIRSERFLFLLASQFRST